MRRILNPLFFISLAIFILLTGCSGKDGKSAQPAPQPAFTSPPEDQGSGLLLFELRLNQESSGYKGSSDIGIPLVIWVDPDNPKEKVPIIGSNTVDYNGRMAAGQGGGTLACYIEWTYIVEYSVSGSYNPGPKCDFDIKVTSHIMEGEVVRSTDCPAIMNQAVSDEMIFDFEVLPPPRLFNVPGSLPVVWMRKEDELKISIQLKNAVVPESTGCFFGGVDTPIPSPEE